MERKGLTAAEVEASKVKYGDNRLVEVKKEGFFKKFLKNLGDPMIVILCVALAVNVIIAIFGKSEWFEPVGIAIAVLLATVVSTLSEYKNENAFRKLQEEASKIKCKVFRDSSITEIAVDDVVVGDVVLLQMGDKVPADGLIVDGNVSVDQSTLNGESVEVSKTAGEVDDESVDFLNPHKIYRGSMITDGNALMQVTAVGMGSVYGKLAGELQQKEDRPSPLNVKLGALAKKISRFGYIGGIAIAVAFLIKSFFIDNGFSGELIAEYFSAGNWDTIVGDVLEAVMLAVVIIVMAVPEGLPLMVALVSAMNMGKMLKDNVLVRKIVGIETAGSLNILFSDKTGTITKGQLEVVTLLDGTGAKYSNYKELPKAVKNSFLRNVTNNTSALIANGEKREVVGGNSTERVILSYVLQDVSDKEEPTYSLPFNSANKYSLVTLKDGKTYLKGAPERILPMCDGALDVNGNVVSLDNKKIESLIDELANRAMRVLAFAETSSTELDNAKYTLTCLVGLRDEVRPESVQAIKQVKEAGVQVVMITGDKKETAVAIAKEAGIIESESDVVLTSEELGRMTDQEIINNLPALRVVARAMPTDKSRLVDIAKSMDLVVGMTGDGVNDSPALKKADVGFAMGSGTEVAKEAGDIVILDDNFSTIAKAVLYGRTIFKSIRKFITFQLTINVAAVLISFIAPILNLGEPLTIIQILWVNLVMDTLAALAFGGEPSLPEFMKEKPKKRTEDIVSKSMWVEILVGAGYTLAVGLVILLAMKGVFGTDKVNTAFFTFFILTAIFNAFNTRTESINLFDRILLNKNFLICMGVILVVQILITEFGGSFFQCVGLSVTDWLIVIALSLGVICVDIIRKAVLKKTAKK